MTDSRAGENDPVARFAEVAERFCTWVESPAEVPEWEGENAIRFLLELTTRALDLPDTYPDDDEADEDDDVHRPTDEAWQLVFRRFTPVPVQYYATCDPAVLEDQGLLVGDVHDDLADTWRDVRHGLDIYRAGMVDSACWHWRFSFRSHWGEHAAGALRVLLMAHNAT